LDDDIWAWIPGSKEDEYWTDERRLAVELNIQAADLVTTPTHALAAVLSELNPRVAVLPNTIPERLLQLQPEHRERFILGWHGSAHHVRDLQQIYNPVLRFMLHHPDVEFHVWGAQGTLDFPDALADRIVTYPWVQSVWGHYYRLSMDIGLAPLDPTDTFNFTKSDIRLREYAALGIPFVASRSDAYTSTANAVRGFLASTEQEWEDALTLLYKDASLREWMAEQGRLRARLWTTEANGIEWERAYERAGHTRTYRNSSTERATEPRPVRSTILSANGDGSRAIQNIRASVL
jgi:glycosyltransferase involved in cell wall biosynthesis